MKITKYNQSCLLIETNNKRILIDPGKFGYIDSRLTEDWININYILVTHKHSDHCYKEVIEEIMKRDKAKLYITNEIQNTYNFEDFYILKEGDNFKLDNIKVKVVKATHGYLTGMRERNAEILENVGYIIDDGNNRIYTTSDTINFYNNYKCDILCMPFNGNGLTMGIIDGIEFVKAINPKLLIPIHMEHPNPIMNPNIDVLRKVIKESNINYKILNVGESIEI